MVKPRTKTLVLIRGILELVESQKAPPRGGFINNKIKETSYGKMKSLGSIISAKTFSVRCGLLEKITPPFSNTNYYKITTKGKAFKELAREIGHSKAWDEVHK